MRRTICLTWIALFAMFVLSSTGCESSKEFTPEDFKKVTPGMEENKVREILGKPFDSAEAVNMKRLWWKVKEEYYSASFIEGKVQAAEGPSPREDYEIMKELMKIAEKIKLPVK